ncbi:MAG: NAD(P)/FAD-dependent oxidoreductase [Acidobacteria bacterium]|nr:NAD(P)/FAD-dependent oxidoreductase [Acidobacteriota bacterium]
MSAPFDITVVGAGPAGIAAAVTAVESGARVLLIDDNPRPGGQIWRGDWNSGREGDWLNRLAASHVQLETSTAAIDERILDKGRKLILATGARELFLPFPGWTLPGVTGVGGLQALIKGGFDVANKRIVLAGSGPLLLACASLAREKGASVMLVAEQSDSAHLRGFTASLWRHPGKLIEGARLGLSLLGSAYKTNCWVESAQGREHVESVQLRHAGRTWQERSVLLATGFGLVPNTELAALLGCHVEDGAVHVGDWQQTSRPSIYAAGELTGIGGVDKSIVEGRIAALAATGREAEARTLFSDRTTWREFAAGLLRTFAPRPEVLSLAAANTPICRCEDIPLSEVAAHGNWRDLKLATRCGMGFCQGRICGSITRALYGYGPNSPRPPAVPAPIQALLEEREL